MDNDEFFFKFLEISLIPKKAKNNLRKRSTNLMEPYVQALHFEFQKKIYFLFGVLHLILFFVFTLCMSLEVNLN